MLKSHVGSEMCIRDRCGPKFCSMKITQEVREYAANQRIETVDAEVAQGLAEQAERFKQEGSQLYKKV